MVTVGHDILLESQLQFQARTIFLKDFNLVLEAFSIIYLEFLLPDIGHWSLIGIVYKGI